MDLCDTTFSKVCGKRSQGGGSGLRSECGLRSRSIVWGHLLEELAWVEDLQSWQSKHWVCGMSESKQIANCKHIEKYKESDKEQQFSYNLYSLLVLIFEGRGKGWEEDAFSILTCPVILCPNFNFCFLKLNNLVCFLTFFPSQHHIKLGARAPKPREQSSWD